MITLVLWTKCCGVLFIYELSIQLHPTQTQRVRAHLRPPLWLHPHQPSHWFKAARSPRSRTYSSTQLRQYQLEKQKGRVFSQRPADFDPRRYVSIRTYENVNVGQPIPENQFQQYLKKWMIANPPIHHHIHHWERSFLDVVSLFSSTITADQMFFPFG